jgi:hypothetical protein
LRTAGSHHSQADRGRSHLWRWPTANALTRFVRIGRPANAATPDLLHQVSLFSDEHRGQFVRTRPIPGHRDAAVSSDKISREPVSHPAGNDPLRRKVILRLRQQGCRYPRIHNQVLVTISHASIIPEERSLMKVGLS